MSSHANVIIREGTREDLPATLALIMELARFEKGEHEVINSLEKMERDGFGDSPLFGFFVAEADGVVVGLSLYYWRYSSWKGKRLYLEDIIVTESWRGKGIGKLLFDRTIRHAIQEGSSGMMWQVLDWNQPAIDFYKKYNARFDGEWINCYLELEQMKQSINEE
jgi:GNAT superfamily N-acetyltransferase